MAARQITRPSFASTLLRLTEPRFTTHCLPANLAVSNAGWRGIIDS